MSNIPAWRQRPAPPPLVDCSFCGIVRIHYMGCPNADKKTADRSALRCADGGEMSKTTTLIIPDLEVWRELEALESQVRYLLTPSGMDDPQIFDSLDLILSKIDSLRSRSLLGTSDAQATPRSEEK